MVRFAMGLTKQAKYTLLQTQQGWEDRNGVLALALERKCRVGHRFYDQLSGTTSPTLQSTYPVYQDYFGQDASAQFQSGCCY